MFNLIKNYITIFYKSKKNIIIYYNLNESKKNKKNF